MKKYLPFFILLLISGTVFAAENTNLQDNEISAQLIGKWRISFSDKDVALDAVDEYLPGGKVVQKGNLTVSGQHVVISMESTWKVENGKLISSLVSVDPEGLIPIGLTTTDTVISIDKEKFVLKDGITGESQTYHRISE